LAYNVGEVTDIGVSDDGQRSLMLLTDGHFVDWDLGGEDLNGIVQERGEILGSVDLSSDGNIAVIGRSFGSILVWDLSNQRFDLAQSFPNFETDMTATFLPLKDEASEQQLLVFDGELSSIGASSTLSIWNVESGDLVTQWNTPHELMPSSVVVDDSGQFAITATSNRQGMSNDMRLVDSFLLWDLKIGEILKTVYPEFQVTDVVFVGNSSNPIMAVTNWENGVALWNMDTGKIIHTYDATSDVSQVQITPDGQTLFGIIRDGQLIQWDFESREIVATYEIGRGSDLFEVNSENSWIVTGYNEKDIAIWNYETHDQEAVLQGHTGKVLSADFTYVTDEDGIEFLQMISSGLDGNVLYWDMEDFTSFSSSLFESRIHLEISEDGTYHTVVPAIGVLDVIYVIPPNMDEILTFIENNRVVNDLTIQDCVLYSIEAMCNLMDMEDTQ
jgi:WD40 repeat protein